MSGLSDSFSLSPDLKATGYRRRVWALPRRHRAHALGRCRPSTPADALHWADPVQRHGRLVGWLVGRSPQSSRDARHLVSSHLRRIRAHMAIFRGSALLCGRGQLAYRGQVLFLQLTTVQLEKKSRRRRRLGQIHSQASTDLNQTNSQV